MGRVPRTPRPHAALPRGPCRPAAPATPSTHPRITHGTLIHHVHSAPYAHSTPASGGPQHPLALAPVREPHPSSSKVFPSCQALNSPLGSPPRQKIPLQTAAANCRLATPQDAFQAGSSRPRLSSMSGPILTPPTTTSKEPDARQGRQGTVWSADVTPRAQGAP